MNLLKSILTFAAAQVPIIGAWLLFAQQAQQNPIVAAVLTVLYEVIAFFVSFVRKVWQELEPEAVKLSADWVRSGVRNFAPGFAKHYNEQVKTENYRVNLGGFDTTQQPPRVERVYVEMNVKPINDDRLSSRVIPKLDVVDAERTIWDFVRQAQEGENATFAIIGPPGIGKTTLLKHIALILAQNKQQKYKLRARIPLLLYLREHHGKILEDKPTLAELAQTHFGADRRYKNVLKPPQGWFESKLKAGRCLVMLDGLDEVADQKERLVVSEWIQQQINTYSRCCFLLTARPEGYREAPVTAALPLSVLPLQWPQVKEVIHKWHTERAEVGSTDPKDREINIQNAKNNADDLIRRLSGHSTLNELAGNPLLLSMIIVVHSSSNYLPEKRAELYDRICKLLLGRWKEQKRQSDPLTPEQKQDVLQPLAWHMMTELHDTVIATDDAANIIKPALARLGNYSPRDFLTNLQADSGMFLMERDAPDRWSFAHKSFQEFLCAIYWKESGEGAKRSLDEWAAMIQDSWWEETLRLYAAISDATPLAQACLQLNTATALELVTQFKHESRSIDYAVRQAIEDRLEQALDEPLR